MKAWLLFMSILVIFAILCSPVLAISKFELIALYKGKSVPDMGGTPVITINFTTPPTPTPTPYIPLWFIPSSSILKPFSKPVSPSSPLVKPTIAPAPTTTPKFSLYPSCPPFVPVGKLRHVMVYCGCTSENPNCECINPETGEHYPIGTDSMGTTFFVKPGCQCTWADESDYLKAH